MVIISAIVTSIDSLIIGFTLKKEKLNYKNFTLIFFFTFLIFLTFQIFFQKYLHFLANNYLRSLIFILLAITSLKEENQNIQNPSQTKLLLILMNNSIDGLLLAITFINQLPLLFTSLIFSGFSTFFLFLGYIHSSKIKERKYLTTILFLLLALINLF